MDLISLPNLLYATLKNPERRFLEQNLKINLIESDLRLFTLVAANLPEEVKNNTAFLELNHPTENRIKYFYQSYLDGFKYFSPIHKQILLDVIEQTKMHLLELEFCFTNTLTHTAAVVTLLNNGNEIETYTFYLKIQYSTKSWVVDSPDSNSCGKFFNVLKPKILKFLAETLSDIAAVDEKARKFYGEVLKSTPPQHFHQEVFISD